MQVNLSHCLKFRPQSGDDVGVLGRRGLRQEGLEILPRLRLVISWIRPVQIAFQQIRIGLARFFKMLAGGSQIPLTHSDETQAGGC
jgi:hypothetical protein